MAPVSKSETFHFDEDYYLSQNPDVVASGMDASEHYLTHGQNEGRSPSALFDVQWYLEANPDVAAAGIDPLEHFLTYGWQEGRDPSPLFETSFYLGSNPDVAEAGINPLEHYLDFGWQEGRNPSAAFNTTFYLTENPDVAASGMNPLAHYVLYGEMEGRKPLPPTLAATIDADGILVISGTAQGDLQLILEGTTATFTREGVEATVSGFDGVVALALDGLTLKAEAPALSGIAVTSGTLILQDIKPVTDLSGIEAAVDVTVQVTDDVDLSDNADLITIDTFEVAEGATLTLSVAQAEAATVNGMYAIRDLIANLLDGAAVRPAVVGALGGTTVTDAATVANLATLLESVAGPLAYDAVSDTVANLVAEGTASAFVTAGTDVEVTGTATLAQLAVLDAANGDGAMAYSAIIGSAVELAANIDGYVTDDIDVEVEGAATIAQLTAIDLANGDGATTYAAIADTLANLVAGGAANPYIVAGTDVAATGVATVADLAAIDAANGDGALTCTELEDTWQQILSEEAQSFLGDVGVVRLSDYALGQVTVAQVQALLAMPNLRGTATDLIKLDDLTFSLADTAANLASPGTLVDDIVTHATAVEATEAATVRQAEIIHERDGAAVYSIMDGSYALANGDLAAVTAAVDLSATNPAQAAEAATILARDGAAGDVTFAIQDTFANVSGVSDAVRNAAGDIAVTTQNYGWPPYLSTAQANIVIGYGNTGRTDIAYIRGTAAEVDGFVAANEETAGPTGLGYQFWVQDGTGAMLTAIGDGSAERLGFMRGNPATDLEGDHRAASVEVTGDFNVAGAETFRLAAESVYAADTSDRTYYGINDAVVAYDNESADGTAVTGADYLRVTDTAASVHAAQNGLDAEHAQIFTLLASRASSSDSIVVSGSAGNQSIRGTMGYDVIDAGADHDVIWAGGSADRVIGGSGMDQLHGEAGRDVLYAGDTAANTVYADARFRGANYVTGGADGDNMFGSVDLDTFIYEFASRSALRGESGTTSQARDYITNFSLGDRIQFTAIDFDEVQFFGSGSANAQAVDAGIVGLSVRYEKNIQVLNWEGDDLVTATRILVDVADMSGRFDDVADMHVILVGNNIDVNWDGYSILYGG